MRMWTKKLVTVITEKAIEDELMAEMKKLGVRGYTVTDARGEGVRGVRSGAWDQAANIRVEVVCEAELADRLCGFLYERYFRNYAMVVYVSEVETLRGDKF